jgi:hypothetical protein
MVPPGVNFLVPRSLSRWRGDRKSALSRPAPPGRLPGERPILTKLT